MEKKDYSQIDISAPSLYDIVGECDGHSKKKSFGACMLSFWQKHLSYYYLPPKDLKELKVQHDPLVFEKLIAPISKYITKSNNYKEIFERIKNTVPGPIICGKVFEIEQPIYSCIDCALDATCVLCVECFKHSEHRFHNYRMYNSSNGCCDCGDPEAWTNSLNCSLHSRDNSNPQQTLSKLNEIFHEENGFENLLNRMKVSLAFILDYCYAMLSWDSKELPEIFRENPSMVGGDCYTTALFNDEIHTYEHVVGALTKAINCDTTRATEIANVVDEEGRCLILFGDLKVCNKAADIIIDQTMRNSEKSLLVKVFHIDVVAHQNFAYRLFFWLNDLLQVCEEYREVYCQHMFRSNHTTSWLIDIQDKFTSKSLVEKIILSHVHFWKDIRFAWRNQIINGLFIDIASKKRFARIFVQNFKEIMREHMNDDHHHHVSIVSLAVQIFTVPSISLMLIEEENCIERILSTFLELTSSYHSYKRFKFGRSLKENDQFRRSATAFEILNYLFDRPIDSDIWTPKIRENFLLGFKKLLDNLKLMQYIDSVVRQIDRHAEYEQSLEHGSFLLMKISPIMKSVPFWASTDNFVFDNCLRILLKSFKEYVESEKIPRIVRKIDNVNYDCYDYDVSSREVSFHLPLSRLISQFCMYLTNLKDFINLPQVLKDIGIGFDSLLEYPLRLQVLNSQFHSGMWRRNGVGLGNHLMHLHASSYLRETTLDADYILLQICAAHMNPDYFLVSVLNKYSLTFLLDGKKREINDVDEIQPLNLMVEEFFKLIYILLVERYVRFIGDVTPEEIVRYEAIQWLCLSPMSNSRIKDNLSQPKGVNIDEQISMVAEFKKPKNSTKHGEYHLKECYQSRFNPLFYRFSRQDQGSAYVELIRKKKNRNEKYICCPPPEVPEFAEVFRRIPQLLICDIMFKIIKKILSKTCDLTDTLFSDSHFQCVLYILGLGLNEQAKKPKEFLFVEKCYEWGLLALLEQCNSRHILPRIEAHQDLLGWTFDKFKEVQQSNKPDEKIISEPIEIDDNENVTQKDAEAKAMRKKKALEHRNAIVAKIKAAQCSFSKDNEEYLKDGQSSALSSDVLMSDVSERDNNKGIDEIALGPHQDFDSRIENEENFHRQDFTCIFCMESRSIQTLDGLLITVGYVQKSTVISLNREDNSQQAKATILSNLFIDSGLQNVTYASGCGHWFHYLCVLKHLDQQKIRDRSRTSSRSRRNYDEKKGEFICPMCKTICNIMIPIMTPTKINPNRKFIDYPMLDWLFDMHHLSCDNLIEMDYGLNSPQHKEFNEMISKKISSRPLLQSFSSEYDSHKQYNFLKACNENDGLNIFDSVFKCVGSIYEASKSEDANSDDEERDARVKDLNYLNSLYQVIANSIQVFERCQRQNVLTLMKIKESIQFICIRSLVELSKAKQQFFRDIWPKRQAILSMKYLLDNTFYQTFPQSILDVDAFGLLVSLLSTVSSIFEENKSDHFMASIGNSVEQNCFLLIFTFHLVQIVLTNANICDSEINDDEHDTEIEDSKAEKIASPSDQNLAQICVDILTAAGHQFDKEAFIKNCTLVSDRIREKMLPFLRCSAMFSHFYTGVSFPKRLLEEGSSCFVEHPLVSQEFEILCNYLGISTGLCFLGISTLKNVALSWAKHTNIRTYFQVKTGNNSKQVSMLLHEYRFLQQSHPTQRLVELPHDYSEVLNTIVYFKCPTTGKQARYPTMCLVCGFVLCSQTLCCQEKIPRDTGSCMKHILKCGKGSGIFLRIRDCKIMLLIPGRGRFLPAPYLDKYGETDAGLKRGSPLYLSNESYQKLNEIWLRHQIPEQIVQYLEFYTGLTAIGWNMM